MTRKSPDAKSVFSEALDIETAEERAAYLDAACGDDQALQARVEGLLKGYANADEARTSLTVYFLFYNHERLHQRLDYRTPAEVYLGEGVDVKPIMIHRQCKPCAEARSSASGSSRRETIM